MKCSPKLLLILPDAFASGDFPQQQMGALALRPAEEPGSRSTNSNANQFAVPSGQAEGTRSYRNKNVKRSQLLQVLTAERFQILRF
jgi:hypothetical protein